MALETAPWRPIVNADQRGPVLIGECTSDNGVHVHRNAFSMCAPALPYVPGCLAVAARPPELRRRSGAFGRRRERPPLFRCLDRHRGGCACARPCQPPPGGRSRSNDPWREGCPADGETRAASYRRTRASHFLYVSPRSCTRSRSTEPSSGHRLLAARSANQ